MATLRFKPAWAIATLLLFQLFGPSSQAVRTWLKEWRMAADPTIRKRANAGMVEMNEKIFIFGGRDSSNYNSNLIADLEMMDPFANEFSDLLPSASQPDPRVYHGMVGIEDQIFIFGGLQQTTSQLSSRFCGSDLWVYSPSTNDMWEVQQAHAPWPSGRCVLKAAATQGQLLIYGGRSAVAGSILDDFWSFDPATQQWTQRDSPNLDHLGNSPDQCQLATSGGRTLMWCSDAQKFLEYRIEVDEWQRLFPLGNAPERQTLQLFIPGKPGEFYMIGGKRSNGTGTHETDDCYYSLSFNEAGQGVWTNHSEHWHCFDNEFYEPYGLFHYSAVWVKDRLLVLGGTPAYNNATQSEAEWIDWPYTGGSGYQWPDFDSDWDGPNSNGPFGGSGYGNDISLGSYDGIYDEEWSSLDEFGSESYGSGGLNNPYALDEELDEPDLGSFSDDYFYGSGDLDASGDPYFDEDFGSGSISGDYYYGDDEDDGDEFEERRRGVAARPAVRRHRNFDSYYGTTYDTRSLPPSVPLADGSARVRKNQGTVCETDPGYWEDGRYLSCDYKYDHDDTAAKGTIYVIYPHRANEESLVDHIGELSGSRYQNLTAEGFFHDDTIEMPIHLRFHSMAVLNEASSLDEVVYVFGGLVLRGCKDGDMPCDFGANDGEGGGVLASTVASGDQIGQPTSTEAGDQTPPLPEDVGDTPPGPGGVPPPGKGPPPGRRLTAMSGGEPHFYVVRPVGEFFAYHVATNRWRNLTDWITDLPPRRFGHSMTRVGNSILMFGGGDMDLTSESWTNSKLNQNPEEPDVVSGTLKGIEFEDAEHIKPLPGFFRFDQSTHAWTKMSDVSGTVPGPRFFHCATELDDTLVIYGGLKGDFESVPGSPGSRTVSNELFQFFPQNHSWQKVVPDQASEGVPGPRQQATLATAKGLIYLYGGCGDPLCDVSSDVNDKDKMFVFDPSSRKWRLLNTAGGGTRFGHVMVNVGNYLAVAGGWRKSASTMQLKMYDFHNDQWHPVEEFGSMTAPSGEGVAAVSVAGRMLVTGGHFYHSDEVCNYVGYDQDNDVHAHCPMKMWLAPTFRTIVLRNFGADFAVMKDYDVHILDRDIVLKSLILPTLNVTIQGVIGPGGVPSILGSGGSIGCFTERNCEYVTIENVHFLCSTDSYSGHTNESRIPVIQVGGQRSKLYISDSHFLDCNAKYDGGAIRALSGAFFEIHRSDFFNCSSIGSGGAVAALGAFGSVHHCSFKSCTAGLHGGAITAEPIQQTFFDENKGIQVEEEIRPTLNISHTDFFTNQAPAGGAIYLESGGHSNLHHVEFVSNVASKEHGGAIFFKDSDFQMDKHVLFRSNTAVAGGGAIYDYFSLNGPHDGSKELETADSVCRNSGDLGPNEAAYGPCRASNPHSLKLVHGAKSSVWPGEPLELALEIRDKYNQMVASDSKSTAEVDTEQENEDEVSPELQGPTYFPFLKGKAALKFMLVMPLGKKADYPKFFTNSALSANAAYAVNIKVDIGPGVELNLPLEFLFPSVTGGSICPAGHKLTMETSTVGTSSTQSVEYYYGFCEPCLPNTYSVDATWRANRTIKTELPSCIECPQDAECKGGDSFVPNQGTQWDLRHGKYHLIGCPIGHKLNNGTGPSAPSTPHTCDKCQAGQYIMSSRDNSMKCQVCPANAVCRNGGPPEFELQTLTFSIELSSIAGSDLVDIKEAVAASLEVDPADIEMVTTCTACGTNGQARRAGGHEIQFEVKVSKEEAQTFTENLGDANFSSTLTTNLKTIAKLETAVSVGVVQVDETPAFPAGEEWVDAGGGLFLLVACPPGNLLINTTTDDQRCVPCEAGSYSVDPIWGCENKSSDQTSKETICNQRACLLCPEGGSCGKAASRPESEANGTMWELFNSKSKNPWEWFKGRIEYDKETHWRICSCPPGHILERADESPQADNCKPCSTGKYTAEHALHYREDGRAAITAEAALGNAHICLPCPQGATCYIDNNSVPVIKPSGGYWVGSPMHCTVDSTGRSSNCVHPPSHMLEGASCDPQREGLVLGGRRALQNTSHRMVHRVYRCPASYCIEGDEVGNNICRRGHEGVGCGVCMKGYAMSNGKCEVCDASAANSDSDMEGMVLQTYVLPVLMVLIVLVVWYFFALRPLVLTEDGSESKFTAMVMACGSMPLMSQMYKLFDLIKNAIGTGPAASTTLKICISFFQVFGSFVTTFEISWPAVLERMMLWTTYIQLDFVNFPGTHCYFREATYFQRLVVQTMFPVVALALLYLPTFYCYVVGMYKYGGPKKHPRRDAVLNRFYQSVMLFFFLIYPSISNVVLRSFNCRDYGINGKVLNDDHSVDCTSSEYTQIMSWSLVMVLLYPIGIPFFMYYAMIRAGVADLARQKKDAARFHGMLHLRKQQMSTLTRSAIANAIGYCDDQKEFKRRIDVVYNKSLRFLFRSSGFGIAQQTIDARNLKKAISQIAGIPLQYIPHKDVADLVKKYDPDRNGLDLEEFTIMINELVGNHTMFTGHESLEMLSDRQLLCLRKHDWTLPVPEHDDEEEEDLDSDGEHLKKQDSIAKLQEMGLGSIEKGASMSKAASQASHDEADRAELVAWVKKMGEELEEDNRLTLNPLHWKDDGGVMEQKAIKRLGFLFLAYKCEVWWFEVLVMIQKLLMSSVIVFFYRGTASQVALGFFISFTFLLLILSNKPLINRRLQHLQVYALVTQCLNLFFGIMLITQPSFEEVAGNGGDWFLPYLLVVLNIGVAVLPIMMMIFNTQLLIVRFKALQKRLERMAKISLKPSNTVGSDSTENSYVSAGIAMKLVVGVKSLQRSATWRGKGTVAPANQPPKPAEAGNGSNSNSGADSSKQPASGGVSVKSKGWLGLKRQLPSGNEALPVRKEAELPNTLVMERGDTDLSNAQTPSASVSNAEPASDSGRSGPSSEAGSGVLHVVPPQSNDGLPSAGAEGFSASQPSASLEKEPAGSTAPEPHVPSEPQPCYTPAPQPLESWEPEPSSSSDPRPPSSSARQVAQHTLAPASSDSHPQPFSTAQPQLLSSTEPEMEAAEVLAQPLSTSQPHPPSSTEAEIEVAELLASSDPSPPAPEPLECADRDAGTAEDTEIAEIEREFSALSTSPAQHLSPSSPQPLSTSPAQHLSPSSPYPLTSTPGQPASSSELMRPNTGMSFVSDQLEVPRSS